jgi:hypothetical protein
VDNFRFRFKGTIGVLSELKDNVKNDKREVKGIDF